MNILLVEDESHTAKLLQEIIEQDDDFVVIKILGAVIEVVDYLSKYQKNIDLMFFDIQLADGKSFEIFKHIDVTVPVVFCTAYDEYSMEAIQNNGIDYVVKPFKEKEIHAALQKYKRLLSNFRKKTEAPIQFVSTEKSTYQQHFLTQFREKTIVKNIEEIAVFCVENETVYFYTFTGERFTLLKKMEYVESVCNPKYFFRINRQQLINRKTILSFEAYFNRKIILHLSVKIADKPIVSRLKVSLFKEWLEQ